MDFQTTASNRAGRLPAIVDGGKGEGLLPLIVIGPQRLHGPSGDGQIAFEADPLDLGKAAQPVVARTVIAAQEGVVGRPPARTAPPPQWIELAPAPKRLVEGKS